MNPAKIHILRNEESELHMMGDYVAVCWRIRFKTKSIKGEDGNTYRAEIHERRETAPYITFPIVRVSGEGEWLDDDDSISGGLNSKQAEQIALELGYAVQYIKETEQHLGG